MASGGIEQCAAELVRGDDIHANSADLRMSRSLKRGRGSHQAQIRNHLAAAAQIASDTDVVEALRAERLSGVFQQLFGAVGAHAAFCAAREGGAFEDLALKGCAKTLQLAKAAFPRGGFCLKEAGDAELFVELDDGTRL